MSIHNKHAGFASKHMHMRTHMHGKAGQQPKPSNPRLEHVQQRAALVKQKTGCF